MVNTQKPKEAPKDQHHGQLIVAGLSCTPEHIARIDDVVRRRCAGETQVNALVSVGFSSSYLQLFRSQVYLERLRLWTCRLELEFSDQRATIFAESLTLARDPNTNPRERVAMYKALGGWVGLDTHGLNKALDMDKPDDKTPETSRNGTKQAVLAEWEVIDAVPVEPIAS